MDDDLNWIDFCRFRGQKASNILQAELFLMLKKHGLDFPGFSGAITIAGPGFYTGLRLSEGFSNVLSFFKIPCFSFLSYEIPKLCGIQSGVWMTKAYRGEYFFHHWSEQQTKNVLIETKGLETYLSNVAPPVFIHSDSALDQVSADLIRNPISTHDLLKSGPGKIFKSILENKIQTEAFYFRAPEDEFRVST